MTKLNGNGTAPQFECVKRNNIRRLCVYLGSNEGNDPTFRQAVCEFGAILAVNGIELVCGGGGRGLMRILVEAVLLHGGYVNAVTPEDLYSTEGKHDGIQNQIVVKTMGVRKQTMFDLADGFVAFPGGVGTLEELVEQITWKQLGHHRKPIGIYNHLGFWDPLLILFHGMRRAQTITEQQPIDYVVAHSVRQVIPMMCGEVESCGRVYKRPVEDWLINATSTVGAQPQLPL